MWIEIVKRMDYFIFNYRFVCNCSYRRLRIFVQKNSWRRKMMGWVITQQADTCFKRNDIYTEVWTSLFQVSIGFIPSFFFLFFEQKRVFWERRAFHSPWIYIYMQHGIKNFFGKLSFAILIISRSNKIFPSSSAQHWCNSYKRYTHTLIKVYPTFTQSRIDKRSLTSSILVDQSRLSRIGKYLHLTALLITFLYILHVKNIFDAIFTSVPLIRRAIK